MNNQIDYGRSIGAVVGGYFVMMGLNTLFLFFAAKLFLPSTPAGQMPTFTTSYLLLMLLISFSTACIGGYVAAAIGGVHRFAHALVLAGIVLLLGILFLALPQQVFPGRELFPTWYPYTSLLTTPLGIAVGGWWRSRKATPG